MSKKNEEQLGGKTVRLLFLLTVTLSLGWPLPGRAQHVRDGDSSWVPQILNGRRAAPGGTRTFASEAKTVSSFLPDFSYAGYHWGEEPLPEPEGRVLKVGDYGAVPDDGNDDTEAVQAALRAAHAVEGAVVVRFPRGRFIIREILFIERSHLIVRGSGSGKEGTVIDVPRPLKEMNVPPPLKEPRSNGRSQFSWQGGVLWTRRSPSSEPQTLGQVFGGRRGFHTFRTEEALGLQAGDVVRIAWHLQEGRGSPLVRHVFCSVDLPFGQKMMDYFHQVVRQEVTVTGVRGRRVRIKEPLLHDLRKSWDVRVSTTHYLEEVGIEHLRVRFPHVAYGGHLYEEGYNAFFLTDLMHSWVQDVTVANVDSGFLTEDIKNITFKGITTVGRSGHHAVSLKGYGGLVQDVDLGAFAVHSLTAAVGNSYGVFSGGRVRRRPSLDQHNGANSQNLFDDLALTGVQPARSRVFAHGGGQGWRPTAAAFNTFWNLRVQFEDRAGQYSARLEGPDSAPYARLVGLSGDLPLTVAYGNSTYTEGINRPNIAVSSLYEYQLARRLDGDRKPSLAIVHPLEGRSFEQGESITVEAEVADGGGRVKAVSFFADGRQIGTDTQGGDGWGVTWMIPSRGVHSLWAEAAVRGGQSVRSAPRSCARGDVMIWVGDEEGLLNSNYPNPFSQKTTIEYAIPEPRHVRLTIYDLQGRKVDVLVDEEQQAGEKQVQLDASGLASGVYFYHLVAGPFSKAGKAVVVK